MVCITTDFNLSTEPVHNVFIAFIHQFLEHIMFSYLMTSIWSEKDPVEEEQQYLLGIPRVKPSFATRVLKLIRIFFMSMASRSNSNIIVNSQPHQTHCRN